MPDEYPFIRMIRSPITDEQLRPLDARCRVVQFDSPLTDSDFKKLAQFLSSYPEMTLRVYGHYGISTDLSFLHYFPSLQSFQADLFDLTDIDGLKYLRDDLQYLGLGNTKKRFSLKPLAKFTELKDLFLEGHTKDFSVISAFENLIYLSLRSISLPDLSPLVPLKKLRSLALRLGGTKDLRLISELKELRYLELWMVRGLVDLTPISSLQNLRFLFLQDLSRVTELPSFAELGNLERCHIENLKAVTDLCPIAAATRLRELLVISMRQIPVAGFQCFRNHPSLQEASAGLGSVRRNNEVAKMLGLRDISYRRPIKEYVEGE